MPPRVTGLFAASVLACVGLWLLPRKRSQAKAEFRKRTEDLRDRLTTALRDEFQRELQVSIQRIRDALAPYDRFVRSERERIYAFVTSLRGELDQVGALRTRVERLAGSEAACARPAIGVEGRSGVKVDHVKHRTRPCRVTSPGNARRPGYARTWRGSG